MEDNKGNRKSMQPQPETGSVARPTLSFYIKCGALFLLFLLSVLVVACGGTDGNVANLAGPVPTVTIRIGTNGSPTPPLPDYWCGAWATQTSPGFNPNTVVGVYAKFTHNVNGNPEGVDGAAATAVVQWPDGTTSTLSATTTPDGLAVFSVSAGSKASAVNRSTLVTVTFTKAGLTPCVVDGTRAAFFTLVLASPTANASATPTGTPTSTPTATGTPTGTPTSTPKPGKSPTPGQ